ncbi:MAG TPA: hypothetical protein VLH86_02770 [Patescibacteria group bacterium]|nr:hypothetical protein [Patescibacteria group bacterium]
MSNPYEQPLDNLSAFTHPDFGQQFRYMDDREGVALAQRTLDEFAASGYESIVAIESGTSPLMQIMGKLRAFGESGLSLTQLKVPRDPDFNLLSWFEAYLPADELDEAVSLGGENISRRQALAAECGRFTLGSMASQGEFSVYDSIDDQQTYDDTVPGRIRDVLHGTSLADTLNQPFLLFDEYINSGTVLRNFNALVRLFAARPEFKVSAYCAFVDDAARRDKISFSLYDKQTELDCYQNGAYPYENRIDLIGYYYFATANSFKKVTLASLYDELSAAPHGDPGAFYGQAMQAIQASGATEALQDALTEEQVRRYVTAHDVARFLLKHLEYATHGETKYADLLDQAFEMYAPAWSPMPVRNHLDYWNGFAAISGQITQLAETLQPGYEAHRSDILYDLVRRLVAKKSEWDTRINRLIKEANL